MNKKQITKFLDDNKKLVGLDSYTVSVELCYDIDNIVIAEAIVDIFEKFINVKLYNKFYNMEDIEKKKVLLHELVHARINVYVQETNEIRSYMEEDLVNDITRGLFSFSKKK